MARMRSPNFPSLSLEEALSFAKVIWDKNRKALIPRDVAAKDLGYTGLTGRSMSVLGALNQYGLVEVTAKGQTRVTQLTEDILIGYPEEVKRQAVSRAGRMPPFFREIYERFDDHIPSENALKSFFFQKGFTNEGVERVLKSFNATNTYVEIYGDSESYGTSPAPSPESPPDQPVQETAPMTAAVASPPMPTGGVLDFQLSSTGLVLTGKTNSASELKSFIEKLKALTVLLPDDANDLT